MRTVKKIRAVLTRGERQLFGIATLTAALAATLLIVLQIQAQTVPVPTRGGAYTEGMASQPIAINPVTMTSEADRALVALLFSPLTDIAEAVEVNNTGDVWTVRLKENVFWSDGAKLTSDDVIFTLEVIQNPSNQSPLATSWRGVTASRVSKLELKFTLSQPYVFFHENLATLYVVPEHIFGNVPVENWRLSDFTLQPVGSGPYLFDSYKKRRDGFVTLYTLKSNPSYRGGVPYLDTFVLRFFANPEELVAAFNQGQIDGFVPADNRTIERVNRTYALHTFELPNYYAVFINQNQNIALKEWRVRRALDAALDKPALAEGVFGEHAIPIYGPLFRTINIPPKFPDGEGTREEIVGAQLDRAGWQLNKETGVREKAIGDAVVPLEVVLTVPDIPFLTDTAGRIKEAWEKVGVTVTVKKLPTNQIAESAIKNRDYEALVFGVITYPESDLFPFWHSAERFHPGLNLALYTNKKVDKLIEAVRTTTDPLERIKALEELHLLITDDYPAFFLFSPELLFVTTRELKGVVTGSIAQPTDRFRHIGEWYLKTARVLRGSIKETGGGNKETIGEKNLDAIDSSVVEALKENDAREHNKTN